MTPTLPIGNPRITLLFSCAYISYDVYPRSCSVQGFSALFANAISMAVGELLGEMSERQWTLTERKREEWEFDNAPEAELGEMVELYREKGFSEDDARRIMTLMSKNKEFFVNHMMVQVGFLSGGMKYLGWVGGV